ncbi:MAG: MFS transporter [Candidatus Bathyarchaeia archaeon]
MPIKLLGLGGNALTVALTDFIGTAAIFLYQPFWSLYVLSLGASAVDLGMLNLVTAIFGAALMAPIGYLSDRIGRKKPVVVSGIVASIGPILQAIAQHWYQLIPGVLVSSIVQVMWPVRQSIVADELKPEERVSGFATFFTIVMLPSAVMPLFSGYVLDALGLDYGMRVMLVWAGILGLFASAFRLMFIREEKSVHRTAERPRDMRFSSIFTAIFEPIIKVKTLQILILGSWGVMFVFGVMNSFGSVYATEYLGVSKTEWGLISSVAGLIGAFMRIPVSRITLMLGEGNALAVSQLGRALYPIVFVHAQGGHSLLALCSAYNLAFNLGSPAYQALITEFTPPDQRGRSYGAFGMMWGTLAQLSSLLGGFIWETFGPSWAFYSAGILAYISSGFLCSWLFFQHLHASNALSSRGHI